MNDGEVPPHDGGQKVQSESGDEESRFVEGGVTSSHREDEAAALEFHAVQDCVDQVHRDAHDATSRLQSRGGDAEADGGPPGSASYLSEHVADALGVHEAAKSTTAHSNTSSHGTGEAEDSSEGAHARGIPPSVPCREDSGSQSHPGNLDEKGFSPVSRQMGASSEGAQAGSPRGAVEIQAADGCLTGTFPDAALAEEGGSTYLLAAEPQGRQSSNLASLEHSEVLQCLNADDADTSRESAKSCDEHIRQKPGCSAPEYGRQLQEEDYYDIPEVGGNLPPYVSDYIPCAADIPPAMEADRLSSNENISSVQQSLSSAGRLRFLRSTRHKLQDPSEWPRFARLLHFSQVELEDAGLDLSAATAHRNDFPRFVNRLFADTGEKEAPHLFPLTLFVEAARLQQTEVINGTRFAYSEKLLVFRDAMLRAYLQVERTYHDRLCEKLPLRDGSVPPTPDSLPQHTNFLRCWFAFEVRYLYEAEKAALRALKPLTECILTLEALMISEKREGLLAPPQNTNQRKCTVKYLQAFCASISHLAKMVLPLKQFEAYHRNELFVVASAIRWKEKTENEAKQQTYAIASQKKSARSNSLGIDYHMHLTFVNVSEEEITLHASSEQAVTASHNLIYRFKELRDFLWARRKCLDHMDPHLDRDFDTINVLRRFEAACRQFRKRVMRPGNLV